MTLGLCSLSKEHHFHYLDDSYILYFSQRSLNKFKLRNPYNSSILCVFDSTTESDWGFFGVFFNKIVHNYNRFWHCSLFKTLSIMVIIFNLSSRTNTSTPYWFYTTLMTGGKSLKWIWAGKKQFVAIVASRVYKRGNGKYQWKPVCSVVNSSVVVLERCYSEQGQDLRK